MFSGAFRRVLEISISGGFCRRSKTGPPLKDEYIISPVQAIVLFGIKCVLIILEEDWGEVWNNVGPYLPLFMTIYLKWLEERD